jgi:hypothetical protein
MLKLKFRSRNLSLIIDAQQNKKTAGYIPERISILPKKIISMADGTAVYSVSAGDGGLGGNA